MNATPSIVSFATAPVQAPEPADSTPLSELAIASRQRDALYLLAEQLALADSAERIHAAALQAIEAALDCDRSSILLFDERGSMQFVAWHGLSASYREAVAGHSPWRPDDVTATPIVLSNIVAADLDPGLKATIFEEGIGALAFIPLQANGRVIGKFMAYFRHPHVLGPDDVAAAQTIARHLSFAIQRQRVDAELAAELAATRALQSLSLEIAQAMDLDALYEKLLDAAKLIMRSDFASMQEYHPHRGPRGELRLLSFRGFNAAAAELWRWVGANSTCSCGIAYRSRKRVIVADVENFDPPVAAADLSGYRGTGIRSVQSTPLLARDGRLVGMISTHWNEVHTPSERDLRLLDILARMAADLIERQSHDEDLRRREERARTLTQLLTDVPWQARSDGAFEELQPAWENYTGQSWDAHAGHGWFEAVHADDRETLRAAWATACFHAQPFEYTARIWHATSKAYRTCVFRATPIRNDDGSLREWVGACLDLQRRGS